MSLIAQALVTADEADAYLQNQNADHDDVIEFIINGVSQDFSAFAGRRFVSAVYTAFRLDGNGEHHLYLPDWPVTTLTSVAEDDVALVEDTDFYADDENGVLERVGRRWRHAHQNILLTLTAGFVQATTLPANIKLAALKEIQRQYQIFLTKGQGELSRSMQGGSVSFASPDEPEWKKTLRQYRRGGI
jgi:hypothetical protein